MFAWTNIKKNFQRQIKLMMGAVSNLIRAEGQFCRFCRIFLFKESCMIYIFSFFLHSPPHPWLTLLAACLTTTARSHLEEKQLSQVQVLPVFVIISACAASQLVPLNFIYFFPGLFPQFVMKIQKSNPDLKHVFSITQINVICRFCMWILSY